MQDDGQPQFPPQRMVRHDAEITADIGDDGADRPAADLGGNLLRRRPVGAVIADICRDLGIMADHPLWRELRLAIKLHGGSLAGFIKDMFERARVALRETTDAHSAPPAPAPPPSLEPACTGPP